MPLQPEGRTTNRRLTRNMVWNLIGAGLPMIVAVVVIPPLIRGLGTPRFGVLTIAWMVVGYFSLFDLGLGRSVTQLVAEKLGRREEEQIPAIVWTAMTLMGGLGLAGALVFGGISPWLVESLNIPADLRSEALSAFYILALSVPIVIGNTGLRGILEAHQRFGLVNLVRAPLGVINYLGPLMVLSYSNTLTAVVFVLLLARCFSGLIYLTICLTLYPDLRRRNPFEAPLMKRLLSYGGWMTVSNIVGPLLLYLGRLLVAVVISVEAVAYFSTPFDVVMNLLILPTVFVSVLFPAFTDLFQSDLRRVGALYRRSLLYIGLGMLPLAAVTFFFAEPGLEWWINEEFSINGYRVAQFLAIGVFISSFGHLSQAVVQGYGRPDITAKLHIAELIAYVPYLFWLIGSYGIEGAAIAWVIRVTISTLVLGVIANRCLAGSLSRRYS